MFLFPDFIDNPCKHCKEKKVSRPRGLCWTCYYTPGVRENYLSASPKLAMCLRDPDSCVLDFYGHADEPEKPTDAKPGSEEKIRILAERAAKGQSLFHKDDSYIKVPTNFVHRVGRFGVLKKVALDRIDDDY